MKLYIALWFDSDDKMFRVAGIYLRRKDAWLRVEELGAGSVQETTLGNPVRFTCEPAKEQVK